MSQVQPEAPSISATAFASASPWQLKSWDGMDGCWSDLDEATGVPAKKALAVWGVKTLNGTKQVRFDEIDYYRIFPADTRMGWDGSEGREMFRDAEGR
jgi:hypothetical protein